MIAMISTIGVGILWMLIGLASLIGLLWTWLAMRMIRSALRTPVARPTGPDAMGGAEHPLDDAPLIQIITPARNEESQIGPFLDAIEAQTYPRLDLRVLNDRSTDQTGEILDRMRGSLVRVRLTVLQGQPRPNDWVGKVWAVHQAVRGVEADWLLFLDADTLLEPEAIARAYQIALEGSYDLVSLLRRGRCETLWQASVGVALAQLLGQLYNLDAVRDPDSPIGLADGGFILVRREAYERAGSHEALRHEIVDDIRLAERVKRAGGRIAAVPAPRLASTHMYGSLAEIWYGLRKNAYAGMDYQPHKFITGFIVGLLVIWIPWLASSLGLWGLLTDSSRNTAVVSTLLGLGLWGVTMQGAANVPVIRLFGVAWPDAFSLPLGGTLYIAICADSARLYHLGGQIRWKGDVINSQAVRNNLGDHEDHHVDDPIARASGHDSGDRSAPAVNTETRNLQDG